VGALLSWSHATGLGDFRVAELGKLGAVVRMVMSVGVQERELDVIGP
jgi:hypothetical protein